jgi:predicted Fe-S protein YdhL (DUF1289 family)
MGKSSKSVPSPCIDVCKYKLKKGHCIGCGMTEREKKRFKKLDGKKAKLAFLEDLRRQQQELGVYSYWLKMYQRKCRKKGVALPLAEPG